MAESQVSRAAFEPVAVIGAGPMGYGVAEACAAAGLTVRLIDRDPDVRARALADIRGHQDRHVKLGKQSVEDEAAILARITTSETLRAAAGAQLVIEAVTEDEATKRGVYAELAAHLGAEAVIASTTSALPITRLAQGTDRPDRFIGLHFMYPVPVMPLMEVVRGITTGEATFRTATAFATALGKDYVVAEDFPGFIVNRLLAPMVNEAIYVLHEGVGTARDIDKAMRLGANHPMGPLALGDFLGLDLILTIMNQLNEGLADAKYRPCPLLIRYVEAGWLGRRVGKGFYDYSTDPPTPTR